MTGSSHFQNDAQEFIRKSLCEIKIIENTDDRVIPFSKRCTTIYKKISMFSTLCGGEILFIIFSPAGKPYSFGYPSVESVAKSFSNSSQYLEETTDAPVETYRKERMNLLVQDFNDDISLVQRSDGTEICHWWKGPIDQLNLKELYEQDERFVEINNLIPIMRDKKIATISSMQAPMDKDVPSASPSRYGPNLQ
ncbi:hypothetical protein E1A91_D06G135400v1 [Gossypium mustelinum]|uniref:MADS-box domain-containing protein n=1 Tax=Gossypium mustelinum TaxID=34275 RepID=A0A5D2UJ18_GOSMU|nr:hypothetical protein E1A91_D06G135400v1 [Gossypium mustelinum]